MPLPEALSAIAREVLDFLAHPLGSPPYSLYVYEPGDEVAVRREMRDLAAFLTANGIDVAALSLADLMWQAVDDSEFYDSIVSLEQANPNDPWALEQVQSSLQEILGGEPSLADRVMEAVEDKPARCVVLLYRAGALYPAFRTSALLDDLRERLRRPVVLLYPGTVVDPFGLRFMGKCKPTHGYRAKIHQRSRT